VKPRRQPKPPLLHTGAIPPSQIQHNSIIVAAASAALKPRSCHLCATVSFTDHQQSSSISLQFIIHQLEFHNHSSSQQPKLLLSKSLTEPLPPLSSSAQSPCSSKLSRYRQRRSRPNSRRPLSSSLFVLKKKEKLTRKERERRKQTTKDEEEKQKGEARERMKRKRKGGKRKIKGFGSVVDQSPSPNSHGPINLDTTVQIQSEVGSDCSQAQVNNPNPNLIWAPKNPKTIYGCVFHPLLEAMFIFMDTTVTFSQTLFIYYLFILIFAIKYCE
jgi:hypothetical protein